MFYRAKKFNKYGYITDSSPTYIQLCNEYYTIENILFALQEANIYISEASKIDRYALYFDNNNSFTLRCCGKNIFYLTKVMEYVAPSAVSWYGDLTGTIGGAYTVATNIIPTYNFPTYTTTANYSNFYIRGYGSGEGGGAINNNPYALRQYIGGQGGSGIVQTTQVVGDANIMQQSAMFTNNYDAVYSEPVNNYDAVYSEPVEVQTPVQNPIAVSTKQEDNSLRAVINRTLEAIRNFRR
jgi:hypothetical protein